MNESPDKDEAQGEPSDKLPTDVLADKDVHVSVRILGSHEPPFELVLEREAPLLEVLARGLAESHNQLIPVPNPPVDRLHNLRHGEEGLAIPDLDQPLWQYLRQPAASRDFGIELVRAFRVNTKWAVAPRPELTAREILGLVGLDYQQYTLYKLGSAIPLPLDQPVKIVRGEVFEAQRDGKYGNA